jgi:hypothetical protein
VALAASLGRFDADVEVVGPPELEEAFGLLAARYAATASARRDRECEPTGPVAPCQESSAVQHRPRPTEQETTMTEQTGYDPAQDPDADPEQLNPRTGAAAGEDENDTSQAAGPGDEPDQDADPESQNPRTGPRAHPES